MTTCTHETMRFSPRAKQIKMNSRSQSKVQVKNFCSLQNYIDVGCTFQGSLKSAGEFCPHLAQLLLLSPTVFLSWEVLGRNGLPPPQANIEMLASPTLQFQLGGKLSPLKLIRQPENGQGRAAFS